MKKILIAFGLSLLMLLTACTSSENTKSNELEVVKVDGDKVVYYNVDELKKDADLIVIGKYSDQTTQKIEYEYSEAYGKDIVTDAFSYNTIEVTKVLKGSTDGKPLKITQRYGVLEDKNQLLTFSELTSMNKGDSWIFFLTYDENFNSYFCLGIAAEDIRFPMTI